VLVDPSQTYLSVEEGLTYYVTVRALTGHDCYQPIIVASSDGITVDTLPPQLHFFHTPAAASDLDNGKTTEKVIMKFVRCGQYYRGICGKITKRG
jgi:hypothetical protein